MGMSASQARLLSLEARQSNLEYQGQQINQERSILSQQCTALYNSLLAMTVPTPPSTNDFTTIEYTGSDGSSSITIGAVKPSGENYCVEIKSAQYGRALAKEYGVRAVASVGTITGTLLTPSKTETNTDGSWEAALPDQTPEGYISAQWTAPIEGDVTNYVVLDTKTGEYRPANEGDTEDREGNKHFKDDVQAFRLYSLEEYDNGTAGDGCRPVVDSKEETTTDSYNMSLLSQIYYSSDEGTSCFPLSNAPELYTVNDDGTFSLKTGASYLLVDGSGTTTWTDKNSKDCDHIAIGGNAAYKFEDAEKDPAFKSFDFEAYRESIRNTFGTTREPEDFYVYIDNSGTTPVLKFALVDDVTSLDNYTETYAFNSNGKYTTSDEKDNCTLEFDTQGRITRIGIPDYSKDSEGNSTIIGYHYIDLEAQTVTDEIAYKEAYSQYEYEQYLYDKKQQEINAKTEIIQQEDRNLELKLQRLDNERTQITTEIEAVKKVINDNIEGSYKTFSG